MKKAGQALHGLLRRDKHHHPPRPPSIQWMSTRYMDGYYLKNEGPVPGHVARKSGQDSTQAQPSAQGPSPSGALLTPTQRKYLQKLQGSVCALPPSPSLPSPIWGNLQWLPAADAKPKLPSLGRRALVTYPFYFSRVPLLLQIHPLPRPMPSCFLRPCLSVCSSPAPGVPSPYLCLSHKVYLHRLFREVLPNYYFTPYSGFLYRLLVAQSSVLRDSLSDSVVSPCPIHASLPHGARHSISGGQEAGRAGQWEDGRMGWVAGWTGGR